MAGGQNAKEGVQCDAMSRFIRVEEEPEPQRDLFVTDAEHRELVRRVHAYCTPLVPDPESSLSVRDQHLAGIVRPRRVRDVAWNPLP
jgi:hypothetical protein